MIVTDSRTPFLNQCVWDRKRLHLTGEDGLTHLQEVLELSDLSRLELPEGMTLERAKQLADPRANARNRCMHHHVFDVDNTCQLLNYCGYRILAHQLTAPSIFVLAKA